MHAPQSHTGFQKHCQGHMLYGRSGGKTEGEVTLHTPSKPCPPSSLNNSAPFFFFLICIPNPFNNKPGSGVSFVAGAGLAASGTLKIPALGSHRGFGVDVHGSWDFAEMPVYISGLAWTREQDGATAFGRVQGQLVEGQNLAPSIEGAAPGRLPIRRGQASFGHAHHGYHPYSYSCLSPRPGRASSSPSSSTGPEATVGATHEYPLQHNLVKRGVRLARNLYSLTNR